MSRKKIMKKIIVLGIILVFFTPIFNVLAFDSENSEIKIADVKNSKIVQYEFSDSKDNSSESQLDLSTDLEINEVIDNIDSFSKESISVYSGNEVIPSLDDKEKYRVMITLTKIKAIDDKDIYGKGDIFCKSIVNGYPYETQQVEIESGKTEEFNVVIYIGLCYGLDVFIEVLDQDYGYTQTLGKYKEFIGNIQNKEYSKNTDSGDAIIYFKVDILEVINTSITAYQLADYAKPYLYISDETPSTHEPNYVYNRVLVGYDNEKEKETICIQYIFYWSKETFPGGITFHEDDYEEFLIFIEPSDFCSPYRIVFDNGGYISNTYRSQKIAIWEEGKSSDTTSKIVFISKELTPLLGESVNLEYEYFNLNNIIDDLYTSSLGIRTMKIEVDTSFHNFDSGSTGDEIGHNYWLSEMTDDKIRNWFEKLNYCFQQGLWEILFFSINTPKVHPFTFDIMNPFNKPYLINAYPNVVDDIESFQKAQENKQIDFDLSMDFGISLKFDVEYTYITPKLVAPGHSYETTVQIEVLEDSTEISFNYNLGLNGYIQTFFMDKEISSDCKGAIKANIPLQTINTILSTLKYCTNLVGEDMTFGFDDYEYFSIGTDYNIQVLGEILKAEFSIHLWEIIKDYLPITIPFTKIPLEIISYFIKSINFDIITTLNGYLKGTIMSSNSNVCKVLNNDFKFDSFKFNKVVEIVIDEEAELNQKIDLSLENLSLLFNLKTDWLLNINMDEIISTISPQFNHISFILGTFPDIDLKKLEGSQSSETSLTNEVKIVSETRINATRPWAIIIYVILGLIVLIVVFLYFRNYLKKR